MIENVSPGVRTFAALSLLFGLLLLVINIATAPLSQRWTALETETQAMREQAGEMQTMAADIGAARDAAEQAVRVLGSTGYLPGDTEAVQLANLQTRVVDIAQRAGLRPQSTRTLTTIQRDGVAMIGLQAVFQSDIARLRAILFTLETSQPRLLIDGLAVTPASRGGPSPEASDLLTIDLRVLAAVRDGRKAVQP